MAFIAQVMVFWVFTPRSVMC